VDDVLGACHTSKGSPIGSDGVARLVEEFAIHEKDPRTRVPIKAERNAGDG
jgi:hypothetical protein